MNDKVNRVQAFAPATCANFAVGFDILGFAFAEVGDSVTLTRRKDNRIVIEAIDANEVLPLDVDKNTASVALTHMCKDLKLNVGFSIQIHKGIPLSSGMGGSAASAVAAVVACNAFLNTALSRQQLAEYALIGEAVASGTAHADNIVPALWGGLTLIKSAHPIEVVQLPIPDVFYVCVHPHLHVATEQARKILQEQVPLTEMVKQTANLATVIAALYEKDLNLLQTSLADLLIEPQRAKFVPGFYQVKEAAMQAGALGMSFSGSGPSLFALARSKAAAEIIAAEMRSALKNNNIESDYWISRINEKGAYHEFY